MLFLPKRTRDCPILSLYITAYLLAKPSTLHIVVQSNLSRKKVLGRDVGDDADALAFEIGWSEDSLTLVGNDTVGEFYNSGEHTQVGV